MVNFDIPRLVPALSSGETFVQLQSGADACLFHRIRGGAAKTHHARGIGRATAQLVTAMASVPPPSLPLPNPLYRNIYDAHHKMSRPLFLETMAQGEFDGVRPFADLLTSEVLKAETLIARILALSPPLPEQMIHADLHTDNVLVDEDTGEVAGVLDFEFTAPDWRCMEMCVGLSKYIGTAAAEPAFVEWVQGYREGGGRLTAQEVDLIPDLIILRVLSNVVYFAGRAYAGEDVYDCLTTRAEMYSNRIKWIEEKKGWMQQVLREHVLEA